MRVQTACLGLVASLPTAFAYWPSYYSQNVNVYSNQQPDVTIETLFQFPNNGSWISNLVTRRDGSLLLTRLDTPEVWTLDPTNGNAAMLHSFPMVTSCFGISEIEDDVFAVVIGNFSSKTYQPTPGSFTVQKIDFTSAGVKTKRADAQHTVSEIAAIPEAVALNGMTTFSRESHLVLIADSPVGLGWKMNTQTGEYSVALNNTKLRPAEGVALPLGVNGLKALNDYVYYSSTTRMEFGRVKVDSEAMPVGDYETIASGFLPDNFDVASDGTAYVATDPQNSVVRITPYGQIALVGGGQLSTKMPGATSCRLTSDEKTVYVGTSGGQVAPVLGQFMEPAKVLKITLN
ncbi:Uncharacterized protein PECH_007863 [Penicillium ucsense]|uniref:SMP-30/Gluconolactonase/LRE-like region domain-containing protein n=1 Tax=Penicillium ucsense TaxID=2839758 RepID=A0A8J8W222_9EURO|nr:Uncharacterized protein PECM_007710 [Penicillium ucsense]KAF7734587.1 Uncharacterized protein PECH_007863 [Penicillium ucsense]